MSRQGEIEDERHIASETFRILEKHYPDASVSLKFTDPLELLVATILSAQCTDTRVNEVTSSLFKNYRTVEDYAKADLATLEQKIRPTGFYRSKAKYIKQSCQIIIDRFNGKVPDTMEKLLQLPGVARKTANIVLSNAYNIVEGIAVDTHVKRISQRLGLTENKNPNKIEKDLMQILPQETWFLINHLLIELGRNICVAKIPKCDKCPLNHICPSAFKLLLKEKKEKIANRST